MPMPSTSPTDVSTRRKPLPTSLAGSRDSWGTVPRVSSWGFVSAAEDPLLTEAQPEGQVQVQQVKVSQPLIEQPPRQSSQAAQHFRVSSESRSIDDEEKNIRGGEGRTHDMVTFLMPWPPRYTKPIALVTLYSVIFACSFVAGWFACKYNYRGRIDRL